MYFKLACGNVRKSFKDFAVYFLTLMLGISVFYAFNSVDAQGTVLALDTTRKQALVLLSLVIGYVSVVIAVVLGFLVVYANRFLIRRRKREFGLYLTLGMTPGNVTRVLCLEALLVGVVSLAAGLLLGMALSQLMLYLTALMFEVTIDSFQFAFSQAACLQTVGLFAVVFLVSLVLNVRSVQRTSLIGLLNAGKVSEKVRLRSLPLSLVLLAASIALIGYAYTLFRDIGLMAIGSPQFGVCTACMVVGTFGFFFSAAGVAQRCAQASRGMYFRGLNMFVFRQFNAKVSSAFASMAVVCIVLFFAITCACSGLSICSAFNSSLEATNLYDVSFRLYWPHGDALERDPQADEQYRVAREQAAEDGYDIDTCLRRAAPRYAEVVSSHAQVNCYVNEDVNFENALGDVDVEEAGIDGLALEGMRRMMSSESGSEASGAPLEIVRASDYNASVALVGGQTVAVEKGQFAFWCDMDTLQPLYRAFFEQGCELELAGRTLSPTGDGLLTAPLQTYYQLSNSGLLVLSDNDPLFQGAVLAESILNIQLEGGWEQGGELQKVVYGPEVGESWAMSTDGFAFSSAQENRDDAVSNTAIVTYLAIYIGFVLVVACAAIIALQQLSEANDNVQRYRLLRDLGAEPGMVNRALLVQVGIYFLAPLVPAICHSAIALGEVGEVVRMLGGFDIVQPLAVTAVCGIAVYGAYFLVTYFASRSIIR